MTRRFRPLVLGGASSVGTVLCGFLRRSPWHGWFGTVLLGGRRILSVLAEKYSKTPAQIVLRWHVQNGLVAIPKTANPQRMRENLDVFDFALDSLDLAELAVLNEGPGAGVDSDVRGH